MFFWRRAWFYRLLELAEPVTLVRDAKTLAGNTSLSADELRRAVAGKTVYLDVSGFELPIRYLDNGRMSGTMGTVAATLSIGDLCIGQRRLVDRGQLSLPAVDKLVGQQNLLLKRTRRGDTVQWFRNDGRSGTARIGD